MHESLRQFPKGRSVVISGGKSGIGRAIAEAFRANGDRVNHAHYAAAKAGVPRLCRSVAIELAPRGIRCNAAIPGLIETPQSLDAVSSLGPGGLVAAAI